MCRHSSTGRARRRQRRGREFEARCLLHTNCSTSGEVTRPSTSTDGFDPCAVHQHVVPCGRVSAAWHRRKGFLWGVSLAGRKHLIVDQKIAGSTPARLATCTEERMDTMRSLKEMVSNNQVVFFKRYRDGELFYRTECGFEFPVPIADAAGAEFPPGAHGLCFFCKSL